jgi:hypothetical protein
MDGKQAAIDQLKVCLPRLISTDAQQQLHSVVNLLQANQVAPPAMPPGKL